jgi:retron-type reverse transcriptase
VNVIQKVVGGETFTYNNYRRKKSSGGFRTITAPDPILKEIQRDFGIEFYDKTKSQLSNEITGFRPGMSIKDNALVHTNKEWVVSIDIKSFFPSTKKELVEWALRANSIYEFKDYDFNELVEILTLNNGLPQGSPASPVLSNYIASRFVDPIVKREINNLLGWTPYDYTRYADDITFSISDKENTKREVLREVVTNICLAIKAETSYTIAMDKIHLRHKSQRQFVTGIIVNEGFSIRKEERMRMRAVMHQVGLGQLELDSKILGQLNFIREINPGYYAKLTKGVKLCE